MLDVEVDKTEDEVGELKMLLSMVPDELDDRVGMLELLPKVVLSELGDDIRALELPIVVVLDGFEDKAGLLEPLLGVVPEVFGPDESVEAELEICVIWSMAGAVDDEDTGDEDIADGDMADEDTRDEANADDDITVAEEDSLMSDAAAEEDRERPSHSDWSVIGLILCHFPDLSVQL